MVKSDYDLLAKALRKALEYERMYELDLRYSHYSINQVFDSIVSNICRKLSIKDTKFRGRQQTHFRDAVFRDLPEQGFGVRRNLCRYMSIIVTLAG